MDRVTPVNYCLGALGILLLQGLLCVEGRSILNTGESQFLFQTESEKSDEEALCDAVFSLAVC